MMGKIILFAWTMIWMGIRLSLFMSDHVVTILNRIFLSAVHFRVAL